MHDTTIQLATAALVVIGGVLNLIGRARTRKDIKENTVITKQTHDIANGDYTLQLHETATALRHVASLTKDPVDILAAEVAEAIVAKRMKALAIKEANQQ